MNSWVNWAKALDIPPPRPGKVLRFDSMAAVVQAAAEGHGVAIVSWPLNRRWFASGSLVRAFEEDVATTEKFHVAYRPDELKRKEVMNRTRSALKCWLEADPGSPVSSYLLAALENNKDFKRAPDDYIVTTFDSFASNFDHKLSDLGYCVPALTRQKLERLLNEPSRSLAVLDAGCGTGLMAEELHLWARRLVGVDLSPGMLAKARARKLYDELVESELVRYLEDSAERFDLLVCADTLCYFGEIDQAISGMARVMMPGALLVFSVELSTHSDEHFTLRPHGRYSHSEAYVLNCLRAAGYEVEEVRHEVLRQEAAQPVDGLLVSAWKTAGKNPRSDHGGENGH